jgi:hypothetical protein
MAALSPLLYIFVHAVLALCWGNLLYLGHSHETTTPLDAIAILLGAAMAAIQISAILDDIRATARASQDEKNSHNPDDID